MAARIKLEGVKDTIRVSGDAGTNAKRLGLVKLVTEPDGRTIWVNPHRVVSFEEIKGVAPVSGPPTGRPKQRQSEMGPF